MRLAVYNENCVQAGHRVPDSELDNPNSSGDDWTLYDCLTDAELATIAQNLVKSGGRYNRRVARTLLENLQESMTEEAIDAILG